MTAAASSGPGASQAVEAATAPSAAADVRRSDGRMEFLDALRGVAATMVLFQHVLEQLSFRYRGWTTTWLRFGEIARPAVPSRLQT